MSSYLQWQGTQNSFTSIYVPKSLVGMVSYVTGRCIKRVNKLRYVDGVADYFMRIRGHGYVKT